jgi:hypothetical protein
MQNEARMVESDERNEAVKPTAFADLFKRLQSTDAPKQSRADWESKGRYPR